MKIDYIIAIQFVCIATKGKTKFDSEEKLQLNSPNIYVGGLKRK